MQRPFKALCMRRRSRVRTKMAPSEEVLSSIPTLYYIADDLRWISGYADDLARALGECFEEFWDPHHNDQLAERVLRALEDGIAKGDTRYRRVTADGSLWVPAPARNYFCQV
jgi:hypothetical protein